MTRWIKNRLKLGLYLIVVVSIPVILLALLQKMTNDFDERVRRYDDLYCQPEGWDYYV